MSKHEKQVRRERKKTDRARRWASRFRHPTSDTCPLLPEGLSRVKHGAAALAAAAVIAAGTQAYADPVRFDNPAHADPGHFHWGVPVGDNTNWLDFTLDAASQPGLTYGPTSLRQTFYNDPYYGKGSVGRAFADIDVEVDQSSGISLLVGHDSGQTIPSGATWWSYGYLTYVYYGAEAFPEGVDKYLGFKFDTGAGDQYGWIGGVRTGNEFEAFAWGYETEVGVPIPAGIPEPGSLALLAFGALAVCRRRP